MLNDKNIVLGVCGGIAAYKAADLVSRLKKKGARVKVIMTQAAKEFVSPLTFQTLSQNYVSVDAFSAPKNWEVEHISLAQWAECMVIAPATANFVGKVASGIADDLLTTTVMATKAPVVIVPAMNTNMYLNRIVQRNMDYLSRMGYVFIEPIRGRLACGDEGIGKMQEPERIVSFLENLMGDKKDLRGIRILVTAGPTREAIDPVRFLTNRSSGKMGYALARAAASRGAEVILVSGPTAQEPPPVAKYIPVESAVEMYRAVMENYHQCQVVIKAAAVSDYRPAAKSEKKIKKTDGTITLELERNPDILMELGKDKGSRILVGFAAESHDIQDYARHKIEKKNADMIVANDITQEGAGFNTDTNIACIIYRDGSMEQLPKMPKDRLAHVILDRVLLIMGRQ